MMDDLEIRWITLHDVDELIDIECLQFEYPWAKHDFLKLFRSSDTAGYVALFQDEIVGYIVFSYSPNVIDIWNIAVAPHLMRKGIGGLLMNRTKLLLKTRRKFIEAVVRESNLTAQLFLKNQNFKCLEILDDFYGIGEPAYRFQHQK